MAKDSFAFLEKMNPTCVYKMDCIIVDYYQAAHTDMKYRVRVDYGLQQVELAYSIDCGWRRVHRIHNDLAPGVFELVANQGYARYKSCLYTR
jgi:hypothetical protein